MTEFRADAAKIVDRQTSRVGFAVIVMIFPMLAMNLHSI
jgi:hypothetical protein